MNDAHNDSAGVIAPPPLIYVAGLGVGYLLHKAFPIKLLPSSLARFVGGLLVGVSFIPAGTAFTMMRRANTRPEPWEPTTTIVTEGPYRYTRNPIYLSFTMLYIGIAALVNGVALLLPLPVVLYLIRTGVIEREEAYLERKFGEEYTRYKGTVRRWL